MFHNSNGALHVAAWKSKSDIVEILLQDGARVSIARLIDSTIMIKGVLPI